MKCLGTRMYKKSWIRKAWRRRKWRNKMRLNFRKFWKVFFIIIWKNNFVIEVITGDEKA